jgi:hypothetical protein
MPFSFAAATLPPPLPAAAFTPLPLYAMTDAALPPPPRDIDIAASPRHFAISPLRYYAIIPIIAMMPPRCHLLPPFSLPLR